MSGATRRLGAALLGLALVVLGAGCSSGERRLEEANALRVKGDPRGALAGYQALLAELGEGALSEREAQVRWKALRFAGDVSYLELGDYAAAMAYYRRIVSLHPGGKEAYEARAVIGDILQDRFNDRLGAIAQWADIAGSDSPEAPRYQLAIARAWLELRKYGQARDQAQVLRERWPADALADEAQLLIGQAWALEKREEEALGAFRALLARRPRADVAARALEAEAHIHAQRDAFDRALELYARALPDHPNPDAVRTAIDAVRDRRERARPSRPGDRAAAFK